MNRRKRRRAKDWPLNLIVGGGAAVLFAVLVGYGFWADPAVESPATTTKTEKEAAMEITITKANFEAEVLKADRPVLVDFWAPWCGPCRMLAPVLAEVAEAKGDKIRVGKVNVDEEPELAARYGITGIPAMLLFVNGNVIATSVGFKSRPELEAFLATPVP